MKKIKLSYLCLRVGLGLTFLWIGIDMFRTPDAWIGFIPASLPFGISRELGLKLAGLLDSALGVLLIIGFARKIVAAIAALHLIAVLITNGIDQVVIRDIGLLGAALALFFWPQKRP